jgi:hypothetical protein
MQQDSFNPTIAPRSIRQRLLEATLTEDVNELVRLRGLCIAEDVDYQVALLCAIDQGLVAAAIFLWDSIQLVRQACDSRVEGEANKHVNKIVTRYLDKRLMGRCDDELASTLGDRALVRRMLESKHTAFTHNILVRYPRLIVDAVSDTDYCLMSYAYDNLCMVAHIDKASSRPIFTTQDRVRILNLALLFMLRGKERFYKDKCARTAEFLADGAVPETRHIECVCLASMTLDEEEHKQDLRAVIRLLLNHTNDDHRIDVDRILLSIVSHERCCISTLLLLFDDYGWRPDKIDLIDHACRTSTWQVIDICMERLALSSTATSSCLYNLFWKNRSAITWDKHADNVLATLINDVSSERLEQAIRHLNQVHCAYKYLLEKHLLRTADRFPCCTIKLTVVDECSISYDNVAWVLQRNPTLSVRLYASRPYLRTHIKQFQVHRSSMQQGLLAHTPLPFVLVDLIVQYT